MKSFIQGEHEPSLVSDHNIARNEICLYYEFSARINWCTSEDVIRLSFQRTEITTCCFRKLPPSFVGTPVKSAPAFLSICFFVISPRKFHYVQYYYMRYKTVYSKRLRDQRLPRISLIKSYDKRIINEVIGIWRAMLLPLLLLARYKIIRFSYNRLILASKWIRLCNIPAVIDCRRPYRFRMDVKYYKRSSERLECRRIGLSRGFLHSRLPTRIWTSNFEIAVGDYTLFEEIFQN